MGKAKSLFKKIQALSKDGFEPLEKGYENYKKNIPDVEKKAKERSLVCIDCEHYEDEALKIRDERIPELDKKMCGNCWCSLPYLLRQDVKICKKWTE